MSGNESTQPEDVIAFWLAAGREKWFAKDDAFDAAIRARFGDTCELARAGILSHWGETRDGRLALVLIFDQFSRNLNRGSARAFATDGMALDLARAAIAAGDFEAQPLERAMWLMLPFEHHEGMAEQHEAVTLCERLGDAELTRYAIIHRDIIEKFGRFPHRNAALGRATTADEQTFLDDGGFAG